MVSALFCATKREIYEGSEDPNSFFRPSLRTLLVSDSDNLNIPLLTSTCT